MKEIGAFAALLLLIAGFVMFLVFADNQLFPREVSFQFEDNKTFLEWYRKALESYQSAAPLFSAWAASCVVVGYTLVKDLGRNDKYVKTTFFVFTVLFLLSIFDLYLSQAYFSYSTYVFDNDYPVFPNTIIRHVTIQKYVHLFMLVGVLSLAGVSLIRKLR